MANPSAEDRFLIPLPGGRAARVPVSVLEGFLDLTVKPTHGPGEMMAEDVVSHSMTIDPNTGASVWHTEWELGHCDFTDEGGYHQTAYVWHRHPLGTEYTEIYQK